MAAHNALSGNCTTQKIPLKCVVEKGKISQWNTVLNFWNSAPHQPLYPLKSKTLIQSCCFFYVIRPGTMSANICTGILYTTSWNVTSFNQNKFICCFCHPQGRINVAKETRKHCWLFMTTPPEPTWITCCSEDSWAVQQTSHSSRVGLWGLSCQFWRRHRHATGNEQKCKQSSGL